MTGVSPLVLLVAAVAAGAPVLPDISVPRAEPLAVEGDTRSVGFTRVVFRIEPDSLVGASYMRGAKQELRWRSTLVVAPEDYAILALERLREQGYDARGGEDLLFDQDTSGSARFQLGAEVSDLRYRSVETMNRKQSSTECRLDLDWQLFDRTTGEVVLRLRTRGWAKVDGASAPSVFNRAFLAGLDHLMAEQRFRGALTEPLAPVASHGTDMVLRRCARPPHAMPGQAEQAMDGAVVVTAGQVVASGWLVSPDGYVVTAAHAVQGSSPIEVLLHQGLALDAELLRADREQDVALLHIPGNRHACIPPTEGRAPIGADIYGIGAPFGTELAFTLSRGIVSGHRSWEGVQFLQTDASLNAGNSGGPLLTAEGRVAAIVSWKIAAPGSEGLSFGVPVQAVLSRLGVTLGDETVQPAAPAPPDRTEAAASAESEAPAAPTAQGPRKVATLAALERKPIALGADFQSELSGQVPCTVWVTTTRGGRPVEVEALECPEELVAPVRASVLRWRFETIEVDGTPVSAKFKLRLKVDVDTG